MSFYPDIYEDTYNTESVATPPPKKDNPKYDEARTLLIKTKYGDQYTVDNVHDYNYDENSKHYWYTTKDNMYCPNYIRADTLFYFGLKSCAPKYEY